VPGLVWSLLIIFASGLIGCMLVFAAGGGVADMDHERAAGDRGAVDPFRSQDGTVAAPSSSVYRRGVAFRFQKAGQRALREVGRGSGPLLRSAPLRD
jgi:hypothetical protein